MRLALDAMGGDDAPAAPVDGAVLYAQERDRDEVLLVGQEPLLRELLSRHKNPPANLFVHHASEVVEMDESAVGSIRKKKDSSLRVCFELLKTGKADAAVSAGNSGAAMAGALFVLGRIEGVERPAIAALFPSLRGKGRSLLLDAGANVQCKPSHLLQFALMGAAYMRVVLGVANPKIGVLANGEEESKGTELTRDALALIRATNLSVKGYVEGKDIFSGEVDVVVTDGFTGNVVLKTSEGTAMAVASLLRTAVERAGVSEKLGALLLKPTFAGLQKVIDYAEYGGAPLLGVDGVAIVAHGRSTPKAIKNALAAAANTAGSSLKAELAKALEASSPE